MKDIRPKLLATFQVEHRDHLEQIRSLLAGIAQAKTAPARADLEEMFRRAHSLKGAARAVDLLPVAELAHRLETMFAEVVKGTRQLDAETTGSLQEILDATEDLTGEEKPAAPAFQAVEMVRITAGNFEGLFRTAGSVVAESQGQDQISEELDRLMRNIALMEKEGNRTPRAFESLSRSARTIRRQHQRRTWRLRQLGKELHQDVSQARMVPAESLLEGYRRMMRDLARDEGKEIEFRATSASVNADRRVLEALKDPIMHLLRNAVSHGIEPAAERRVKGKEQAGIVTLRIDADGQRLTVTVEDDGRGVDFERVAEVAAREGISQGTAQDLTRILFRPGFSTAASITSLAGRGMGLSVVYEAIRRLQGDLDLHPAAGGGTSVSLSAPLSIASHRLMILHCGGRLFAIPFTGIERLLRVPRSAIEMTEGKPIVLFRGKPVALAHLHSLLGLGMAAQEAQGETMQIVILKSAGRQIGLMVDAVVREADAVIQDLGRAAGCGGKIASGVVLDDGKVAFVVNPMELLESALEPGAQRQLLPVVKVPEVAAPVESPSVLVVDDSMTTRTLEKSILEAHGYRVRIAVDGVDALARLREEKAELVIADVEMPRLNGFGLVEAMKKDRHLMNIPVIIVSSLERREDQERGLALGADAYIVKHRFDQHELLATIQQII